MSLLQLIGQEWLILTPLFFCSVLVIAVVLERIWTFSRTGRAPKELMRRVEGLVANGEDYEAVRLLDDYESPYARVARVSLMLKNPSKEEVTDMLTLACDTEISVATRPLPILGTIGNISLFIGLLGTVIGILRAFQKLGTTGPATISTDIALALIATAIGLSVGIVAVVANNWCLAWVERYRLDLERFSTEWAYRLQHLRQAPAQQATEPIV